MSFTVKDILKMEVALALGCTEPVAIALAAAAAATLPPTRDVERIEIWLDPNIYKNGLAVTIPGSGGMAGLDTAAALCACGGDVTRGMEVLETLNDKAVACARRLLTQGRVTAESSLVAQKGMLSGGKKLAELEEWLRGLALEDIFELVSELDAEDLAFLEEGVVHNLRLAEHGLKYGNGLGIGKAIDRLLKQKLLVNDMATSARRLTSAAADARMDGVNLPAMSSAGSGNHGLTAILPIWAIKDFITHDHETVLKAIGLSHIITAYVKAHTGRLSAVCGCSVAAGAGATAGITYLVGGDVHHMEGAIQNIMEDLAGVICDGAKAGCALKLNTAAGAAVQAALFSLQGVNVKDTDGIIGNSTRKTIQNMGALSHDGMEAMDRTILKIMRDKQSAKKK